MVNFIDYKLLKKEQYETIFGINVLKAKSILFDILFYISIFSLIPLVATGNGWFLVSIIVYAVLATFVYYIPKTSFNKTDVDSVFMVRIKNDLGEYHGFVSGFDIDYLWDYYEEKTEYTYTGKKIVKDYIYRKTLQDIYCELYNTIPEKNSFKQKYDELSKPYKDIQSESTLFVLHNEIEEDLYIEKVIDNRNVLLSDGSTKIIDYENVLLFSDIVFPDAEFKSIDIFKYLEDNIDVVIDNISDVNIKVEVKNLKTFQEKLDLLRISKEKNISNYEFIYNIYLKK